MNQSIIINIGGIPVYQTGGLISWASGLAIDADGSPHAYHPNSAKGLDDLSNAGEYGNWWGLVTNSRGVPIKQGADDPAPGYFVSTTALQDYSRAANDPRRYVDAEQIPYVVLSPRIKNVSTLRVGDFALVINTINGLRTGAIIADEGPVTKIGEGSIALANALKVPSSPRIGGAIGGILTIAFPGSRMRPAWPLTAYQINASIAGLIAHSQTNVETLIPRIPA